MSKKFTRILGLALFVLAIGCGARTPLLDEQIEFRPNETDAKCQDTGESPGTPAVTGVLDPNADNDLDGYVFSDDCDDRQPSVNPGAIEVAEDGVDNDCDGMVDQQIYCDESLPIGAMDAKQLARSMGICRETSASAAGKNKTWGLISASLLRLDGSTIQLPTVQAGILPAFGPSVPPLEGKSLLAISTGTARLPGQAGYQTGYSTGHVTSAPSNEVRNQPPCSFVSSVAADSIVLSLMLRVPTNAHGIRLGFNFFTSEFPKYVCEYNDSSIIWLEQGGTKQNLALDKNGYSINVNNPFLEACYSKEIDVLVNPKSPLTHLSYPCPLGPAQLQGNGFNDPPNIDGAATGWLFAKGTVTPGTVVTLSILLWDAADGFFDSTLLLDSFSWSARKLVPGADRVPCE